MLDLSRCLQVPPYPVFVYGNAILPFMSYVRAAFLGTGDAFAAGGRHQSGYLIYTEETALMLDCGATALAALKRGGFSPSAIDAVFISHLHGDHFAGLAFLLLEYCFSDLRTRPLLIAGPPGIEKKSLSLYKVAYGDLADRPLRFKLEFLEMSPDKSIQVASSLVTPFLVPHQDNEISFGFSVLINGRKILYSGDTGWTEALATHSQAADLFICECSFFETRFPYHLDYPQLVENRKRFGAKRIILTHLGREVLARRDEIDMELASDGLIVDL